MTENVNLERIERDAWRSYFQDGVWDMTLGLLWVGLGMTAFLEGAADLLRLLGYVLAIVPAYVVFVVGKKYVTTPRLGLVRFGAKRNSRTRWATLALAASVVFGVAVMLLILTKVIVLASDVQFGAVVFGANAVVVFSAIAYFLDFSRLYAYGLLFASSIVFAELTRDLVGSTLNVAVGFGAPGAIVALIGAAYMFRFVRAYPLPAKDGSNAA